MKRRFDPSAPGRFDVRPLHAKLRRQRVREAVTAVVIVGLAFAVFVLSMWSCGGGFAR